MMHRSLHLGSVVLLCLASSTALPAAQPASAAAGAPVTAAQRGQEDLAAARLRTVIFPAQTMFQAMTVIDEDGDGRGQFAFLKELCGGMALSKNLTLISTAFAVDDPVIDGYRFACVLPDERGGFRAQPAGKAARPKLGVAEDASEKHWLAFAWPADPAQRSKALMISATGKVHEQTYAGTAPDPRSVFVDPAKPDWAQFAPSWTLRP